MRPIKPLEAICIVDPCTGCNYDSPVMVTLRTSMCVGPDNCNSSSLINWICRSISLPSKSGAPTSNFGVPLFCHNPAKCPVQQSDAKSLHGQLRSRTGHAVSVRDSHCPDMLPCDLADRETAQLASFGSGCKVSGNVATTNDQQVGLDANWYASQLCSIWSPIPVTAGYSSMLGRPAFLVQ